MFADDFQNHIQSCIDDGALADCVVRLNKDLASISKWALKNKLLLNRDKLQAILIKGNRNSVVLPDIIMDGVKIDLRCNVKNLGMKWSNDFSWSLQCNSIVSKVYAGLRSLSVHRDLIPVRSRINLVKSLLLPHFTYCDAVYVDGLIASDKKSIERAFNACVRFAFGLKKRQSIRNYSDRILGCDIMQYLSCYTLMFIHNLILRKVPEYLYSKVMHSRSDKTFGLNIPSTSTARTLNSMFVSGISRYNRLPIDVRSTASMDTFRRLSFRHICRRP